MPLEVRLDGTGTGMTSDQIETYLKDAAGGYSQDALSAAFNAVQDKTHWKNPVNAIVDRDQIEILTRAIPWFTGTEAAFSDVDGDPDKVVVTAPGYFAGPCN